MQKQILEGIKKALLEGEARIVVNEASAITGSGSEVGGKVLFDDAFAAARYANPFRQAARQITVNDSDAQFVAKVGNAADATNPWGYTQAGNTGSPDIDTTIWQLPVRVVSAQIPVRTAVLEDVNNLDATIVDDLMLEFSALEAASMALNNDQAGSATASTGGTEGLRGLATYLSGSSASFGSSGTALTNGIHTIASVTQAAAAVAYDDIVDTVNALPSQYWSMPGTAWMIHPVMIQKLRKLKATGGLPIFLEVGDYDGGAVAYMFGFPVVPNPYLAAPAAGAAAIYLANWPRFMTIGDYSEITLQRLEQTQPGFVTLYGEKRVVSTVRDVFAGVRLIGA